MEKQTIAVPRKTIPFKCSKCHRLVNVNYGRPMVIETDDVIIQSWDYGHQHKNVFRIEVVDGKQVTIPLETEDDG